MERISCNEQRMCFSFAFAIHTHSECIIFSLRVAIDIRATMCLFSLCTQYTLYDVSDKIRKYATAAAAAAASYLFWSWIWFKWYFFQLYFALGEKKMCARSRSTSIRAYAIHIVISHGLHWIHHFGLISNNNNRRPSNLLWHSTFLFSVFLLLFFFLVFAMIYMKITKYAFEIIRKLVSHTMLKLIFSSRSNYDFSTKLQQRWLFLLTWIAVAQFQSWVLSICERKITNRR